jgi:predicted alpha/beta hydrolase
MGPAARLTNRGDAPPDDGKEVVEIHTKDGKALRATVREPKHGVRSPGVAVLAHAMFARRGEWERAGFAAFLQERGWRTIAFDYRGHGESGPGAAQGATWTYDDLVTRDLPAVIDGARARAKRGKVIVIGHSLGGHTTVAGQATGALDVDGIALVASSLWLPAIEPSPARWAVKKALVKTISTITEKVGRFPARALRQGSDDEAAAYMMSIPRIAGGLWGSEDGKLDYWDAMRFVRTPLYSLVSAGDSINVHPECASRFALRAAGRVTFDLVRASDDGSAPPGHMEIVTQPRAKSAWARLESWMRG